MRVEYPDASKFTHEQREQFDRVPINLTRMLLHCPVPMVQSLLDFALSFRTGNLEPKIRELVILRMATLRGSSYELKHHLPAAKMAGLSEQEISVITSAQPSCLDQKLSVMIQVVDECSQLGKVSESTFEKASKIFSASEIAEATLLAGVYEMLACFLKTMGVDMDQHALSWSAVDSSVSRDGQKTSAQPSS
ncbi:MAG: carboxymuconolactone decarboxylase family protein [Actinobacteria bacterium]|nr:carboxymuconolactone decarboxylase family protein [Actinomycetota bacterium]